MFKKIVLIAIIILMTIPAHAQDNDEELVAYVENAFTNLYSYGTYTIEGIQLITMKMTAEETVGDETIDINMSSDFHWILGTDDEGDTHAASGGISATMDMEMDREAFSMVLTQEVVFQDNLYYYTTSASMQGETVEEDWTLIDLNELDQVYLEELGVDEVDFDLIQEQTGNQFMTDYVIPITPDTVASIVELNGVTEDGRTLRVFDIEIDYAGLLNEDFDSVFEALAAAQGLNSLESAQFEDFFREFAESITATQQVYIDVDTELPYRTIMRMTFDFASILATQMEQDGIESFIMETEVTTIFSEPGAPFRVSPPKDYVQVPAESMFQ